MLKSQIFKKHHIWKRLCAFLICFSMLFALVPTMPIKAEAASLQDEYLNKLVEWGIMRGDLNGNLEPSRAITRAEFVSLINRSFGYTKTTSIKFKDVPQSAWYYDDIRIAVKAGYFFGNSSTEAAPDATLTREEAVTFLCRNIMLQEIAGEDMSFTDSRLASSWSRGYIKAAAQKGIVSGDTSGTFRPLDNITRGEVAVLLARVIGNLAQEKGTYSESVSGNFMINTSGVTLENMTITGDLYITAGVGLGYTTLNNVKVYGQIIASGAGESNEGDCSIIIKNTTASEMIVDSPSNQYVTIRTAGSTVIDNVYVRTDTYLEDKTQEGYGMKLITVDGEEATQLDVSGNINEIITMTPESEITVGSGTVKTLTVDENATDSVVTIDKEAVVEVLNLDVAASVEGKGDIGELYVNAPGCEVEMLPDYIYIRPGITANINGTDMDSTLAAQMSDTPRILSGYPRSDDIAPTQLTAKYQTNKEGTIYWAVRLSGDGEMSAQDIISPPSYGAKVVKSGKVSAKEANAVVESKISGLKLDTSYVLCAVLVDERGENSQVKTFYFTTPDNTKPAFTSGYPKTITTEDTYVIFDVAANKNCTLYWAIYKKGMTAPTANDFKDQTLSGAIDSGTLKMVKNEDDSITMGNELEDAKNALTELTDYDAYFFLTDGVNEASVKKVSITTADRTPPKFMEPMPRITDIDAKKLTGQAIINEDGTIYWALVERGTEFPIINPVLTDPAAIENDQKLQIMNGNGALKSGKVSAKEAKAASISFSGLEAEKAYDIYFVAEDKHGNLSDIYELKNAKTEDETAPTVVSQTFNLTNDATPPQPLASTDVIITFSEDIYSLDTRTSLFEMYQLVSQSSSTTFPVYDSKDTITFDEIIDRMFTLQNLDISDPNSRNVPLVLGDNYQNIRVQLDADGQTVVTFKNAAFGETGLLSGTEYQFTLNNIIDGSNNDMKNDTKVEPAFHTLDAQIDIDTTFPSINTLPVPDGLDDTTGLPIESGANDKSAVVNTSFSAIPYANSTKNAADGVYYDILITSDISVSFDLYRRERTGQTMADDVGWEDKDGNANAPFASFSIDHHSSNEWTGLTIGGQQGLNQNQYALLKTQGDEGFAEYGYDYAIVLKSVDGKTDPTKWNETINLKVFIISGTSENLKNFIDGDISDSDYKDYVVNKKNLYSIGNPVDGKELTIVCNPKSAPQFRAEYPRLSITGDSAVSINFHLDSVGYAHYIAVPCDVFGEVEYAIGKPSDAELNLTEYEKFPADERDHKVTSLTRQDVYDPSDEDFPQDKGYIYGRTYYSDSGTVSTINLTGLKSDTEYYIFFTLKGSYKEPSPVMVYKFKTNPVVPPILTAYGRGSNAGYYIDLNREENQTYVEAETCYALYIDNPNNYPEILEDTLSGTTNTFYKELTAGTFNQNATQEEKEKLWEALSNPKTAGVTPVDSGTNVRLVRVDEDSASADAAATKDLTYPDLSAGNHILLVGAYNYAQKDDLEKSYVFDFVTGISNQNIDPPKITGITSDITKTGDSDMYKGTINIIFDKSLEIKLDPDSNTTQAYEPDNDNLSNEITPYTGINKITTNEEGNILIIDFSTSGISSSTFTLLRNFYAKNGNLPRSPISIKFVPIEGSTDKYNAVISGGEFNGQTSEITPTN